MTFFFLRDQNRIKRYEMVSNWDGMLLQVVSNSWTITRANRQRSKELLEYMSEQEDDERSLTQHKQPRTLQNQISGKEAFVGHIS